MASLSHYPTDILILSAEEAQDSLDLLMRVLVELVFQACAEVSVQQIRRDWADQRAQMIQALAHS